MVEFAGDQTWRQREALLDRGELHGAFVCGWHYAARLGGPRELRLVGAPVLAAPRYRDRPIYFSDIVVAADSAFRSLDDLCGATVAFNDRDSHSGYNVLLERVRGDAPFFAQAVESGSHTASMALVSAGRADCAAIDTTVLDLTLAQRSGQDPGLRVIETLGPSTAPPIALHGQVPRDTAERIEEALVTMHHSERGRAVLAAGLLARFDRVTASDYSEIGEIGRRAAGDRLA